MTGVIVECENEPNVHLQGNRGQGLSTDDGLEARGNESNVGIYCNLQCLYCVGAIIISRYKLIKRVVLIIKLDKDINDIY